jgi:AsmA-like C-terminal region
MSGPKTIFPKEPFPHPEMISLSRKHTRTAAAAALAAFLLAAGAYLAYLHVKPRIKNNIETTLSRELGGSVRFERLSISLAPLPSVSLNRVALVIPKTVKGTIGSIRVYPQILPLIRGKLLISKIRVTRPRLSIALPETVTEVKPSLLSLLEVHQDIRLVLHYLGSLGPGLVGELHEGAFVLTRKGRLFLSLRNASARVNAPPGEMGVELRATTEHWGDFGLTGTFEFTADRTDARDLSLSLGRSSVTGLRAGIIWRKHPGLEILAGKADLLLDELFSWLSSSGTDVPFLRGITSLKGSIVLDSIRGGGLIGKPASWERRITGSVARVSVESDRLPAPLFINCGFDLERNSLAVSGLSARMDETSVSRASARLSWKNSPYLTIHSATAFVSLKDAYKWSSRSAALDRMRKNIDSLSGAVTLSAIRFSGSLRSSRAWVIDTTGAVRNARLSTGLLPGPLLLSRGTFSFARNTLFFSGMRAGTTDFSGVVSGSVGEIPRGIRNADLAVSGRAGPNITRWLFTRFNLPLDLRINAPLAIDDARLSWQKNTRTSGSAKVVVADGPALDVAFHGTPSEFALDRVSVVDRGARANLAFLRSGKAADISFSGTLAMATLNRIFRKTRFGAGGIRGDFSARVRLDHPPASTSRGKLEADHVVFPRIFKIPLTIERAFLRADGRIATLTSAAVTWGKTHYTLSGTVAPSETGIALDGDVAADSIVLEELIEALTRPEKTVEQDGSGGSAGAPRFSLNGELRIKSRELFYDKYRIDAPETLVSFGPDNLNIAFSSAQSCGISLPGSIVVDHGVTSFHFAASADGGQLEQAVACLTGESLKVSGTYSLSAELSSRARSGELTRALEGNVRLSAKNGTIYRYPLLAKIFSILSVTEIFRGKAPELGGSGFPYHSLDIDASIKSGVLKLDHAFLDGSSIDLIAEGTADLAKNNLDLVVLVAPFPTINWVIRHTPVVNKLMGGTLISIPVKVTGAPSNPDVVFLSPSAVGTRLIELLENIIHLPVYILSPILPKHEKPEQKKVSPQTP